MKTKLKTQLTALLLCIVMLLSVACTASTPTPDAPSNPESGEPEAGGNGTPESGMPEIGGPEGGDAVNPDTPVGNEPGEPDVDEPDHPANGAEKIVTATKTMYITTSPDFPIEIPFAHYESTPEILMMDMELLTVVLFDQILSPIAQYTYEETESTLKIIRSNGAYCLLDFVADSVYFSDFDLFSTKGFSEAIADTLSTGYLDSNGNPIYFKVTDYTNISGQPIRIDLAERNIPLDIYNGKKYIPLQTVNDLFLCRLGINFLYNAQTVFMLNATSELPDTLKDRYYSIEPTERSRALIDFTYNELCLMMELYYGLQDEHGMTVGFEAYLEHTGLLDEILSPDAKVATNAIGSLLLGYLADKHSLLELASPYTGSADISISDFKVDPSITHFLDYTDLIQAARDKAMPDGVSGYQEFGNTAFVTFDVFTLSPMRYMEDYSEAAFNEEDTIGLIIYAHSQITRENSPIQNVVIDLSCNAGGHGDAAVYVVAWMLGYCDFRITNPITNSFSTCSYAVDVNLDGVFDSRDSIANKNLYCLISSASFSSANMVPALLKESGTVTLIGTTSGGGACAVQSVSLADGTLIALSSPSHLSVATNGAYYSIDRGVEPHIHLSKLESFYDRAALAAYINGIL